MSTQWDDPAVQPHWDDFVSRCVVDAIISKCFQLKIIYVASTAFNQRKVDPLLQIRVPGIFAMMDMGKISI